MIELRYCPSDTAALDGLFQAFSQSAVLNPGPDEEDDDDGFIYAADDVEPGSEQEAMLDLLKLTDAMFTAYFALLRAVFERALASDAACAVEISRSGAIAPLVDLLASGDTKGRTRAAVRYLHRARACRRAPTASIGMKGEIRVDVVMRAGGAAQPLVQRLPRRSHHRAERCDRRACRRAEGRGC